MPIYCYKCENCLRTFEVKHGMFFEQDQCTLCNKKGFLSRIPALLEKSDTNRFIKKTGDVVKEFIHDAQKEVKEEKKRLSSEEL